MFKNKAVWIVLLISLVCTPLSFAQEKEWTSVDAYQPSPVLFVHGIARDAKNSWQYMVNELDEKYSVYYPIIVDFTRPELKNSPSARYLHSFDYAENPANTTENNKTYPGTFKSVAENAWNKTYALQHAVRDVSIGYDDSEVVIIGHGMGGLLGKYYLKEKEKVTENPYVSRFVTLGTPHWGTMEANKYNDRWPEAFYIAGQMNKFFKSKQKFQNAAKSIYETGLSFKTAKDVLLNGFNFSVVTNKWSKWDENDEKLKQLLIENKKSEGIKNLKVYNPMMEGSDYGPTNDFIYGANDSLNNSNYPDDIMYVHTVFQSTKEFEFFKFLKNYIFDKGIPVSTSGAVKRVLKYFFYDYLGNAKYEYNTASMKTKIQNTDAAKRSDMFVPLFSQEGYNAYANVTPVISYAKGEDYFFSPSAPQVGNFYKKDSFWPGEHFFDFETTNPQYQNEESVLHALDGIETYAPRLMSDFLDIRDVSIQGISQASQPLVELTDENIGSINKTNIPLVDWYTYSEKPQLSFLSGVKGNQVSPKSGQEYLPASIETVVYAQVTDELMPFSDIGKLKASFTANTSTNEFALLVAPDKCYLKDGDKYAYYNRSLMLNELNSTINGTKYVYLQVILKNAAGVTSQGRVFVFRVYTPEEEKFEIKTSATMTQGPVIRKNYSGVYKYEIDRSYEVNFEIRNIYNKENSWFTIVFFQKNKAGGWDNVGSQICGIPKGEKVSIVKTFNDYTRTLGEDDQDHIELQAHISPAGINEYEVHTFSPTLKTIYLTSSGLGSYGKAAGGVGTVGDVVPCPDGAYHTIEATNQAALNAPATHGIGAGVFVAVHTYSTWECPNGGSLSKKHYLVKRGKLFGEFYTNINLQGKGISSVKVKVSHAYSKALNTLNVLYEHGSSMRDMEDSAILGSCTSSGFKIGANSEDIYTIPNKIVNVNGYTRLKVEDDSVEASGEIPPLDDPDYSYIPFDRFRPYFGITDVFNDYTFDVDFEYLQIELGD